METLWINGEFMPISEGKVSVEDRALLFADGIYEVIAAYEGVPILLEEHLDRWERSAAGLQFPSQAPGRQQRYDVIMELVRRGGYKRCTLYGQLSRGVGRRAHQFPKDPKPSEFWFVRELPPYNPDFFTQGVNVATHPDERWTRCWIKSTSLLPNCLAKQYAVENNAFEAVLYREDNIVTEGAVANFSIVKDGAIFTHPTDGRILGGVKREFVLNIARQIGIPVREEKYTVEQMRAADEAFLTSTTINVLPVTRIDGAPVASGKVGPVTQKLMDATDAQIQKIIAAAHAAV